MSSKTTEAEGSTIICYCFKITKKQAEEAVSKGYNTLELLQKETGVSTACSACLRRVEVILKGQDKI